MVRLLTAAAFLTATLVPSVAAAATYSAKPAMPAAVKRIVVRDIAWACGPEACQGRTDYGRPLLLCQGLAKQAGRLESFAVDGRALGAAELDKCNSAARDTASQALARAN